MGFWVLIALFIFDGKPMVMSDNILYPSVESCHEAASQRPGAANWALGAVIRRCSPAGGARPGAARGDRPKT